MNAEFTIAEFYEEKKFQKLLSSLWFQTNYKKPLSMQFNLKIYKVV